MLGAEYDFRISQNMLVTPRLQLLSSKYIPMKNLSVADQVHTTPNIDYYHLNHKFRPPQSKVKTHH